MGVSVVNQVAKMITGGNGEEGFVTQAGGITVVPTNSAIRVVNKVAEGFLVKKGEAFVTQNNGAVQINTGALEKVGMYFVVYSIFITIFVFLICYGSARTSYCYNIAIGNTADVAFLFSVLCFFFPNFYYPFYALFLNPLCSGKLRNKSILGGKMVR